jgi:hypothetical protein
MMSRIDSRYWKISTGRHFQNGHQNTAKISLSTHISNFDDIGQCWIFTAHFLYRILASILKIADISKILKTQNCSSNGDLSLCQIYMWVDNDVPNWFPKLKNFYRLPFSKWPPQYRKNSTLSDIIKILYVGRSKILKTQNCSSNGDLSLCQILCLSLYI